MSEEFYFIAKNNVGNWKSSDWPVRDTSKIIRSFFARTYSVITREMSSNTQNNVETIFFVLFKNK